jgi:hypothetical protein
LNEIYALPQPVQQMTQFISPIDPEYKKISSISSERKKQIADLKQSAVTAKERLDLMKEKMATAVTIYRSPAEREELLRKGRERIEIMRQNINRQQIQTQAQNIQQNNIYNNNIMNPVPDMTQRQRASRPSIKKEKVIKNVDGQVVQRVIEEETPLQQAEELVIKKMRGRGRPATKEAIKEIPGSEVLPQPATPKKAKTTRAAEPKLKPLEKKLMSSTDTSKELKKIEKERAKLEKLRNDFMTKLNKLG